MLCENLYFVPDAPQILKNTLSYADRVLSLSRNLITQSTFEHKLSCLKNWML